MEQSRDCFQQNLLDLMYNVPVDQITAEYYKDSKYCTNSPLNTQDGI